jgi:imidazolonepropionase-like amidohydrolase
MALTDCTVVDVRAGVTRAHQNIIIHRERIGAVGPTAGTRIPKGSRSVGCAEKFAIPGLWDMHVHVGEIEENWFPLYLANGVTGLREMFASEANVSADIRRNSRRVAE